MSYRYADMASQPGALELFADSAGRALACDFSSSDEYEAALIAERRAQGRYDPHRRSRHLIVAIIAVAFGCGALILLIG